MQGSLDQPPIMIRSSPTHSILILTIDIVFVTIFVFMLRDPASIAVVSYLGIVFFGAGIPIFTWRLIRPDILILSPDGITWRSTFRTINWSWDDVGSFRTWKPGSEMNMKHVGFDFTDNYLARSGRLFPPIRDITGVDGSLGTGWELKAAGLAELLNQARTRWTSAVS